MGKRWRLIAMLCLLALPLSGCGGKSLFSGTMEQVQEIHRAAAAWEGDSEEWTTTYNFGYTGDTAQILSSFAREQLGAEPEYALTDRVGDAVDRSYELVGLQLRAPNGRVSARWFLLPVSRRTLYEYLPESGEFQRLLPPVEQPLDPAPEQNLSSDERKQLSALLAERPETSRDGSGLEISYSDSDTPENVLPRVLAAQGIQGRCSEIASERVHSADGREFALLSARFTQREAAVQRWFVIPVTLSACYEYFPEKGELAVWSESERTTSRWFVREALGLVGKELREEEWFGVVEDGYIQCNYETVSCGRMEGNEYIPERTYYFDLDRTTIWEDYPGLDEHIVWREKGGDRR